MNIQKIEMGRCLNCHKKEEVIKISINKIIGFKLCKSCSGELFNNLKLNIVPKSPKNILLKTKK